MNKDKIQKEAIDKYGRKAVMNGITVRFGNEFLVTILAVMAVAVITASAVMAMRKKAETIWAIQNVDSGIEITK